MNKTHEKQVEEEEKEKMAILSLAFTYFAQNSV